MSKQIAKLLRADISESSNLMEIARMLEKKGRGNDTLLAHITKKEAQMLKDAGGSGTVNPDTGLLEFYDGEGGIDLMQLGGGGGELGAPAAAAAYNPADFGGTQAGGEAGYKFDTPPAVTGAQMAGQDFTSPQYQQAMTGFYAQPTGVDVTGQPAQITPVSGSAAPMPSKGATELTADKGAEKSFFDKMSDEQKMRLGLAGGLGLFGAYQGRQAGKQAEARAGEMKSLGAPYQKQGTELQRAAMAGELTPQSAQAFQALQARLAQGAETRGGVGAQQAAAQAEAFRQQLLAQQYNLGLQVSNVGDQIAVGAIRTGMQADQQLSQVNNAFYTNLAAIAAGIPMRTA